MLVTRFFPADAFKGTTVFVTGGGSGINLGIAKNFAALGADVAICGRKQDKLDRAADELRAFGGQVHAEAADVRDAARLEVVIGNAAAALGPIGVLVCGAAGNFPIPAEELSPNGFKTVVDIDLLGSFNATRAAFEQLRSTRGCVIFISAGMAYVPFPYQVHVGAAKAGIDMMMRNLALEWGKYGIRANSIVPGPIGGTEGMRRLGGDDYESSRYRSIPLGRFGGVDDIGQAAVFLASPLASYVTGTVLVVDGGSNLAGSTLFGQAIEAMRGQGG
ncbi:MAG: SDR family oxidoreductase [Burkholderiales bacterium]|nr:SDR family oxidoreductase [Burkholderiales bacterium]